MSDTTETYTRQDSVPRLIERPGTLDAQYYNLFQLAISRLGAPLRLQLPGLKVLDIILQKDAFIIVDRVFNDVPVIAWCNFKAAKRDALDAPVACDIRWYHIQASMITKRALNTTVDLLSEQLGVDKDNLADIIKLESA